MARFVGIDVAKPHLDVALLPEDTTFRVPNDVAGWATLIARLDPASPTGIVVEATSTCHVGVTLALAAAGMPAAAMNPQRTAAFKTWAGRHAKTDRADARALAAFAAQQRPTPTPVPSDTVRALRERLRCRDGLTQTIVDLKNRLETATEISRGVSERLLDQVTTERAQLERQIADTIAADGMLAARRELLGTAPGIGAPLVAGLPELGLVDTKALYQMAVTAVRWDPAMRAHHAHLRTRRPRKVALVAVARHMLGMLNAMLRDGLTWQDTRVGQGEFLPERPEPA